MRYARLIPLPLLLAAMLLLPACGSEPTPEARFWAWFQENSRRLQDLETTRGSPLAQELGQRIEAFHPDLSFDLWGRPGKARELILTADGNLNAFPAVQVLGSAAPSLPGWTVTLFRPRRGTDVEINYDGFNLNPRACWFRIEPDDGRVGLYLFMPGLRRDNRGAAIGASFIMLDAAIGEFDAATRIGFVRHDPLPEDTIAAGLLPFRRFPEALDNYRSGSTSP